MHSKNYKKIINSQNNNPMQDKNTIHLWWTCSESKIWFQLKWQ